MANWLGGGFSQITGQITNFTREVLTEGTEEVDDAETELKLAKRKIQEFETTCLSQKSEAEKVNKTIEELHVKLEASELQKASISKEYKGLLDQKEVELKQFKQQHEEMLQFQSKMLESSNLPSPLAAPVGLTQSSSSSSIHGFENEDFGDVISFQHEINGLRSEVQRLESERNHWRRVANSTASVPSSGESENQAGLHTEIRELKQRLLDEVDEHQRELSTLQDVHAQKLSTLKKRHKEQINQLRDGLPEGQKAPQDSSVAKVESEGGQTADRLRHLEEVNHKLTFDLDQTHAADREKSRLLEALQAELAEMKTEIKQLTAERKALTDAKALYLDEIDALTEERQHLKLEINDAMEKLQQAGQKNQGLVTSTPIAPGKKPFPGDDQVDWKAKNDELNSQVQSLRKEAEDFEMVRSDWQLEKEALEDVLLSLRQQIQERDEQLKLRPAVTTESAETESKAVADLRRKLEASCIAKDQEIENRNRLQADNAQLQAELISLKQEVKKLRAQQTEGADVAVGHSDNHGKLSVQFEDQKSKLEEALAEKEALEVSLEELDTQNQQAMTQIIQTRDRLLKTNEELNKTTEQLTNNNQELNESNSVLNSQISALRDQLEEARKAADEAKGQNRAGELQLKMDKLQNQLMELIKQIQLLEAEKLQRVGAIEDMQEKNREAGMALNDLHMDKQDLEAKVNKLEKDLSSVRQKLGDANREKQVLQKELEDKSASSEDMSVTTAEKVQNDPSDLQEETSELRNLLKSSQEEVNTLKSEMEAKLEKVAEKHQKELSELDEALSTLQKERDSLQNEIQRDRDSLEKKVQMEKESLRLELQKERDSLQEEWQSERDSLQEVVQKERTSLQEELQKAKEESQKYINQLEELNKAGEKGASNMDNIKALVIEKDDQISQLQKDIDQLKEVTRESQKQLQASIDTHTDIESQLEEKEAEVETLLIENEALREQNEAHLDKITNQEMQLKKLSLMESHCKELSEKEGQLQGEVEELQAKLQDISSQETPSKLDPKSLDIISELESEITSLRQSLEEKDKQLKHLKQENQNLVKTSQEQSAIISQSKEKMAKDRDIVQTLEDSLGKKTSEINELLNKLEKQKESTELIKQNGNVSKSLPNGDINSETCNQHNMGQLDELQKNLVEKDKVITALNDTNSSMLKLLEERSIAAYGNSALVDLHKLQSDFRALQTEKEHMMSVLNEKSRECSQLKSENHRLVHVISQQKTALTKLQSDNTELSRNDSRNQLEDPNEDMTKEAIRRLSQMVRDKDMEVEALNQKNHTLLQVLQESPGDGSQLAAVIQERDTLAQQIKIFQNDRGTIIEALNSKHAEAVAYHAEVQRLSAIVSEETHNKEKIQQEYANLVQQYEDKQRALLKTQNELVNYKQKYVEVDNRYKEILSRHKQAEKQGTSAGSLRSPSGSSGSREQTVVSREGSPLTSSQASPVHSASVMVDSTQVSADSEHLTQELEDLKAIIASHETAFSEKDKTICDKDSVIQEKERTIMSKDHAMAERMRDLGELRTKLSRSEEMARSRESELTAMKKQYENAAFQLQGVSNERDDFHSERDQLKETSSVLQHEISAVQESNNKLSMGLQDRDIEINALKDKVNTLTKLVQESGEGEKGEMDRLMKETEAVQQQVQTYKMDRDQAFLAVQQLQAENQQLRNQIQRLEEREEKLLRELERLRGHLLQIEEEYTQEALGSEEREKELRTRLANAEERMLSSSTAVHDASLQASHQVEALQLQVHQLAEQRDSAVMQLSSVQETANQYATSLANLQMVLEQFQMEKEQQQAAEVERLQKAMSAKDREIKQLREQLSQVQMQLDDTTDALEAAQRLSEQLDRKEEMVSALREEVQLRENELMRAEEEIAKLTSNTEAKVDKLLVKNLVLAYFHTPSKRRREALQVIGQVLSFSNYELQEVGEAEFGGGWLGGLFKRHGTPTPPTTPIKLPGNRPGNGSFSQLFVNFLEKESSPQPQLRLPAEQMVKEQQEKQQAHKAKPAFNPFAAPAMHTTVPLRAADDSPRDDHLLMKPLMPSLPVFTPLASAQQTLTPPIGSGAGQGSGRDSANSSGRSTPATSGAILRDVLLQ